MATESGAKRINVSLDGPQAQKLAELAGHLHLTEGTLARSLLSTALDQAPRDPENVLELLDRIPGAWERIDAGIADMEAGRTRALGEL